MFSEQGKTASYPTDSALKNYYIESNLPAYVLNRKYNSKPIPKTKDFYKNDKFIWNNPYRSSQKTYKYYHQQQDQYRQQEEKVKKEQREDKQRETQVRMNSYKTFRLEERNRLMTRKSERTRLQNSCFNLNAQPLATTDSSKRSCRMKSQLRNFETECTHQGDGVDNVIQEMVKSTILMQRQGRIQQLRDRKTQIEELVKRSGQSMRVRSRPLTANKSLKSKMFKQY